MPHDIFMTVEATEEGETLSEGASSEDSIGAFSKAQHEDKIYVLGFQQRLSLPTDRKTGGVVGNRRHEYLTITKLIDKSSPLLHAKLVNPTKLDCELEFFRPSDAGGEGEPQHYYTITLEKAKIVSIETTSPNLLDPRNDDFMPYEVVTFLYGGIDWVHEVGSTNASDTWSGE
ncbi:type VI secretion system tube protein TssD [Thiohalorhabdus methylotrophus]|uniref:Type VI secretion system tube protein TssD n=1 Tax=Thiohalorhabdus methylotrophus TaxID=3242694 RepID=A0ABV4TSF8_9GAMM